MSNSYQQSEYDENDEQRIFESHPAGEDDPAAAGNDGRFNNEKEATKSVNGNDFDKIIDIPAAAVNINEASKEESKGGDQRIRVGEHRLKVGEVSQMILAIRAPFNSMIQTDFKDLEDSNQENDSQQYFDEQGNPVAEDLNQRYDLIQAKIEDEYQLYLKKRYKICFNANILPKKGAPTGYFESNSIQIYQIKNFNVKINIKPEDPNNPQHRMNTECDPLTCNFNNNTNNNNASAINQ